MVARLGAALVAALLAFAPGSPATASTGSLTVGSADSIAIAGVVVLNVRLSKGGSGSGRITSDPPYLDCGVSCETSLEYGEKLVLIADPDPGSKFSKWTGFCAGQGARCTFTLTVDVTTRAVFTAVSRATPKPSPAPTATPSATIAPTPTAEPTIAATAPPAATAQPTAEPTSVPEPSNAEAGSGPIVLLLAILLVGLLGGLGVVIARGRRKGTA